MVLNCVCLHVCVCVCFCDAVRGLISVGSVGNQKARNHRCVQQGGHLQYGRKFGKMKN